jgi:hypothetical protein
MPAATCCPRRQYACHYMKSLDAHRAPLQRSPVAAAVPPAGSCIAAEAAAFIVKWQGRAPYTKQSVDDSLFAAEDSRLYI